MIGRDDILHCPYTARAAAMQRGGHFGAYTFGINRDVEIHMPFGRAKIDMSDVYKGWQEAADFICSGDA